MSTTLEPITIISRYVEQEYRVESTMYRTGRDPEVYLSQEVYLREDADAKIAELVARLAQKDRDYANLRNEVESGNSIIRKVFNMSADETAGLRDKLLNFEQQLKEQQDIHDEYVRVLDAANKELAEDYDKLKKEYDALRERFDAYAWRTDE